MSSMQGPSSVVVLCLKEAEWFHGSGGVRSRVVLRIRVDRMSIMKAG